MEKWTLSSVVATIALVAAVVGGGCVSHGAPPDRNVDTPPDTPLDFSTAEARAEIENFLRSAKVVGSRALGEGITDSSQLDLEKDGIFARALWKTIDESVPIQRFTRGKPEMRFKDSYLHEIAAYELDKILELGMVPPTVERHIGRSTGCVQLWLEGTITETERKKKSLSPPNIEHWNRQMFTVRLFHQLIDDTDYNNISNLLVDSEFNIYIIDSSRAFRFHHELRKPESLQRFSRSLLDRLRGLDVEHLRERLGRCLSKQQINAIIARRDLIIAHAEARVAEFGEDGILYP